MVIMKVTCVDVGAGDKVGTLLIEGIAVDSATRIIGCGSDVNTPLTPKAQSLRPQMILFVHYKLVDDVLVDDLGYLPTVHLL